MISIYYSVRSCTPAPRLRGWQRDHSVFAIEPLTHSPVSLPTRRCPRLIKRELPFTIIGDRLTISAEGLARSNGKSYR